jgi:hypothetical protein
MALLVPVRHVTFIMKYYEILSSLNLVISCRLSRHKKLINIPKMSRFDVVILDWTEIPEFPVQISTRKMVILFEILNGFPQFLHVNACSML